jgi:hypothetical protein
MKQRTTDALIAFGATGLFTVAYFLTPFLARRTSLIADFHARQIVADASFIRQYFTASPTLSFERTSIQLRYDSPVWKGSSADVTARIEQSEVFMHDPTYPDNGDVPDPQPIHTLHSPIKLTLKSAAFEFAELENEKKLPEGTHLPVKVIWAPLAKSEGNSTVVLSLDNISRSKTSTRVDLYANDLSPLSVDINGKKSDFGPNDEISLPISIYTKGGIPAWLWEDLTIAGAVLTSVLGSSILLGWFQSVWKWITKTVGSKPMTAKGVVAVMPTHVESPHEDDG